MREDFIVDYIPKRIKQLGYKNYHTRYRDIAVLASSKIIIPAFNELWFIIDDPSGIIIESNYGIYDSTGDQSYENAHQHRGEIIISNPDITNRRVKFIQAIIVN